MAFRLLVAVFLSVFWVTSVQASVEYSEGQSLRVIGSTVLLREEPYQGAPVVKTLEEYDHLVFLGEYTVEPITTTVRGERVTAPYIRVRADNRDEGWIFAGLVASDVGASLLPDKLELLSPGDTRDDVIRLYGRDYVTHDHRMTSSVTRELLDILGTREAWEYYYFRSGEGVVFGFEDDRIASILVREDVLDDSVTTYWRTVEGYLNHPLRPECHETPDSANCDDYLL